MFRKIISAGVGLLRRIYHKVMGIPKPEPQVEKDITISVKDLFFMQMEKQELTRYDIVVRYLAIEDYYGQNNIGWSLYRKMQSKRVAEDYTDEAEEKFKALIRSYDKNGYDESSRIKTGKSLGLWDGSHRIAMHIYHNIPMINITVLPEEIKKDYTIDWFFKNGFTFEEIEIIKTKARQLTEQLNTPFSRVIWAPAMSLKDDILKTIFCYAEICDVKTYSYSRGCYENVVKAVYAIDDIESWKVEKKLEYMSRYDPVLMNVRLKFTYPEFRIKKATNLPLSVRGERLKNVVRKRFEPYIDNYFYDIIAHIADNYSQSEYMDKVFEPGIDIERLVEELNGYKYALLKTDAPHYPDNFPENIPVGKDIDIICLKDDFGKIQERINIFRNSYKQEYEIHLIEKEDNFRVRFEKSRCLILQIDLSCRLKDLSYEYLADGLGKAEKYNGYYVLPTGYECICRIVNYYRNNTKTHHLDYLKANYNKFDSELFKKYCRLDISEIISLIQE